MTRSFQKLSGFCALLAGLAGLLYLVLFLILKNPAALLPALALLAVGLFASVTLAGIYQHVRLVDESLALIGLLFGFGGALGAAVHAAFDLANSLHPPASPFGYASPVDPRGFLTFAAAGVGAILLSRLILQSRSLPRAAGYLGIASGIFLVLLYLAYLILFNPLNPIVLGLILISGLLQPVWYLWVGSSLLSAPSIPARMGAVGPLPIPATGERSPEDE